MMTVTGGARCAIRDTVGASHAAIPGHFPGHPVVPAVVLLERVSRAVAQSYAGAAITRIEHVKFLEVLRPGEPFEIVLSIDDDVVSFQCVKDTGSLFAAGRLRAEVNAA
jgi:3-hydroxyacyl-[acyl-carrier-protein] dehydratase